METRDIIKKLREKNGLTQEQMAERLMISRQAVSRWENGETQPDTESLKLLSKEFNVSINTLLGTPRQLICQCCGMPLNEDSLISREKMQFQVIFLFSGQMDWLLLRKHGKLAPDYLSLAGGLTFLNRDLYAEPELPVNRLLCLP